MTTRRRFLALAAIGLLSRARHTAAQPRAKLARLGYLLLTPLSEAPSPERAAFLQRLRELGYVEGGNLVIEYRSAEWEIDRVPALAAELVAAKVDVIFANDTETVLAVKRAGVQLPVIAHMHEPVALGIVGSLARPGGNFSGLSIIAPELAGKRLELFKGILPKLKRLAVLWNPASDGAALEWRGTQNAARGLGMEPRSLEVRNAEDLLRAFERIKAERPQALAALSDARMISYRKIIADFAEAQRLPTLFGFSEFAAVGGLISYGLNLPDLYRRAAVYVDKILKGAKPADLPVEQPTKFELIVNLKTAKALGLRIPPELLVRADQVIQ
jgi:putative ABC transport system substrate-binding protein